MLVDARERFAARAVKWMMEDEELTKEDMTARIGLWDKKFQKQIIQAVKDYEANSEE